MKIVYIYGIILIGFGVSAVLGNQSQSSHLPLTKNKADLGIVGGKNASIESFPYLVSVYGQGVMMGSAVILNRNWILTTAYIVVGLDTKDILFRAGSNQSNTGGMVIKAQEYTVHPNYTGTFDWDIAVVKVEKPIKFSKNIKPVKIARRGLKHGHKALIAGWGSNINNSSTTPSATLQQTNVTVLGKKKCKATTQYKHFSSRNMCTYDENTGPVVNDYSDPLVVGRVVHGLFAGGFNLQPGTDPLLYSDVSKYYKWIKQQIRE